MVYLIYNKGDTMKITLFLPDKLVDFKLPSLVSGNFSFDSEKVESKLINVIAKDNQWFLYQTEDVKIVSNNVYISEVLLVPNHFYVLEREKNQYLIYAASLSFGGILAYSFLENSTFSIGNTTNSTIRYNIPYLNNMGIQIECKNHQLTLQYTGTKPIYINQKKLESSFYQVSVGDELNVYGLTVLFLHGLLLIKPIKELTVDARGGGILQSLIFLDAEPPQNIEVKDVELYSEKDYYSKSPRLRRVITTETIKLSAPPKSGDSKEVPVLLIIGPMLTMGITSVMMLTNTLMNINIGRTTFSDSWPQLVMSGAMLVSMLVWPLITQWYNRRQKKKNKKEIIEKYTKYLQEKERELEGIREQQKIILYENLIPIEDCLTIMQNKNIHFWDKRIDQSDFLVVRLGIGREFFDAKIEYPEEGFTIEENELRDKADALVRDFQFIENVPLGYSLYENKITAIMGTLTKSIYFTQNLLVQLLTFYSYEDLKIVLFTEEERCEDWKFIKYLNHSFDNEKSIRFFSKNKEDSKEVSEYLNMVFNMRKSSNEKEPYHKPHYVIVIDGWDNIYQNDIIKNLTEEDTDLGFSIIIIENSMGKLPSKCNNFISLDGGSSKVLKNAYNEQIQMFFKEEIHYNIPMLTIAKNLSNIPIEFEDGFKELPNAISFLEMERVGKVSQLNILNRWNVNDSTSSLRAEIGVDERGDVMYLDLHEKYHGPHGLIAGMTGSGKSEFIITYILSMAINYSPDDVAFILIDYKGGGLAFAFENKASNMVLPHLAGTITNLDKAEMDRTLVSIDSEIKYRQKVFNEARDLMGESTIDIYKYQTFYKEGRLKEPIPHLFIVCDEFAELKAQQPDFMDNLISVARIGRSLGVHLILATQKPSGVVNDQIWSNTKFRVCLKVQDESDSREMLKRPEAASIKQTGRFYLQVGFDEYFALGQSAWCGAKYYPSDKIMKQVDKSLNYINSYGRVIKSIQATSTVTIPAEGEQLASILGEIISISNATHRQARRLWLPNIPEIILEPDVMKKYDVISKPFSISAVIGEYDAPERQEQGIVTYHFLKDGNTLIYGNDGSEREMLLNAILYSSVKNHTVEEINFYIVDFGSESLRRYQSLLHMGGIVFAGEDEKFHNLLKLLREEIQTRKKLFADFGGDYENYIESSGKTLPLKVVMINNYESVYETYPEVYDEIPELVRDSERYGIVYIFTATAINGIPSKITQNCKNVYAFKLKDSSDYISVFGVRTRVTPRDIKGRGLLNNDGIHEFQVCSIQEDENILNSYLAQFIEEQNQKNKKKAKKIPVLPEVVRLEDVKEEFKSIHQIPIGISKKELEVVTIDLFSNLGNMIASNRLYNTEKFLKSLLSLCRMLPNTNVLVIDPLASLKLDKIQYPNYYTSKLDEVLEQISLYIKKLNESQSSAQGILFVYGINRFINKLKDPAKWSEFVKLIKESERISLVILDDASKLKAYTFESWFTSIFTTSDGIWIGRGISDQNLLRLSTISKEMTLDYKTDMGYFVSENVGVLTRFIDFVSKEEEDEE